MLRPINFFLQATIRMNSEYYLEGKRKWHTLLKDLWIRKTT
jgi:hypothetical protein